MNIQRGGRRGNAGRDHRHVTKLAKAITKEPGALRKNRPRHPTSPTRRSASHRLADRLRLRLHHEAATVSGLNNALVLVALLLLLNQGSSERSAVGRERTLLVPILAMLRGVQRWDIRSVSGGEIRGGYPLSSAINKVAGQGRTLAPLS